MNNIETGVDVDLPKILESWFKDGLHPGSFYKDIIDGDYQSAMLNKHPLIDFHMTVKSINQWMNDNCQIVWPQLTGRIDRDVD